MSLHGRRVLEVRILLAAVWSICLTFGCNNAPSRNARQVSTPAPLATAARPQNSDHPGINLQCAAERIQNAPAPFHWSFKKTVTPNTNADWEADVTADAIDGTFIDSSGTRAIHGARSDQTSWNTAVMILTAPLPASAFALVNNSSAIVRVGERSVNGEDAIKYTIDTSRDTPADASLIRSVLGADGFVKGTAWVTNKGCPIKFVLVLEQHNQDAAVEKEHDEENVTNN